MNFISQPENLLVDLYKRANQYSLLYGESKDLDNYTNDIVLLKDGTFKSQWYYNNNYIADELFFTLGDLYKQDYSLMYDERIQRELQEKKEQEKKLKLEKKLKKEKEKEDRKKLFLELKKEFGNV